MTNRLANRVLTPLVLAWILASQIWYYLQFSAPVRSILSSLRVHVWR